MTTTWYAIRLFFYPPRLILYWIHSVMVFISKPGAKIVVPVILIVVGLALRTFIDPLLGNVITQAASPFIGSALFDLRIEIAFALLFVALYLLMWAAGGVLSPVAGTFPAPKRPMPPLRPLQMPMHKIKTVKASLVIKKPVSGYFNGNLDRLVKRLPPDIRPLLDPPPVAPSPIPLEAEPVQGDQHGDHPTPSHRAKPPPPPPSNRPPPPPALAPEELPAPDRRPPLANEPGRAVEPSAAPVRPPPRPSRPQPPPPPPLPPREPHA